MRSVMMHQFSQVPKVEIPRSSFDRSHGCKSTFNAGWLVPFYLDDVLPGDTFNCEATMFMRLATPLHPFMDNLFVDTFFFFVPYRLIWTNFPRFFGEQPNPGDSTDFLVPTITAPVGGYAEQSIYDYFGLPTKVPGFTHSALPLRAYNLIFNQWFRDQNLTNSLGVPMGDGPDVPGSYGIQNRAKRHDYFTSALPWPQKGPAVQLPLGSSAIVRTNPGQTISGAQAALTFRTAATGAVAAGHLWSTATTGNLNAGSISGAGSFIPAQDMYPSNLYADLSTATAATINQIRQSFQVQRMYERDARGGTRYTEIIKSHFGVTSPDARLQRAEYLGGGVNAVNVNPIAQTSSVPSQPTPQGNLAAMGTAHGKSGFTKSFTEHGIIIGLVSARADLNYQQGVERMWTRSTRFDFYWPALSHLGEQAILNKEIYCVGSANPTQDAAVFGYQERYAEYRYKPSKITGKFRSNATTPLDTWHLAQNFSTLPALNTAFINEDPPIARVIAVPTEPHFLFDSYIRLKCDRPMPVYGVPGLVDHF